MVAAPTAPAPSVLRTVEKLLGDGEMRLSRCASDGRPPVVLVVEPVRDPPPASVLRRLEQEYALRAELEFHDQEVVLATDLADGLDLLMGDRVQLQQVVLNLLMNGIEAMS